MSKIQLNLLPDVKLEFNKNQHNKKFILSLAFLICAISASIFLLMVFTVDVVQKKQLSDAGKSVDRASQQLQSVPQINQIITVQNQLKSLTTLHQSKHITSRIYGYLQQVTPANVTVNKLDLDLKANTLSVGGDAASQANVNSFVDTLKAATYKVNSNDSPTPAFSAVVQSAYSPSKTGVSYAIIMSFDPRLFTNTLDSKGKPISPSLTVKTPSSTVVSPQGAGGQ